MSSKRPDRTTMEGMIWNAIHVCDKALDPSTPGVPHRLLEDCRGVVLLSVVEAGFIFSGNVGTGVVLAHDHENTGNWSAPSAIGLAGVGWGALVGAEVKDILMVLTDRFALDALSGDGQVKLGGQLGVTIGPVGREIEGAAEISNRGKAGITFTYSFTRGLFAGIGLEGAVLAARSKENDRFYGVTCTTPHEVLFGGERIKIPEGSGVAELHRKLDLMKEGKTAVPGEEELSRKESLRLAADLVAADERAKGNTDGEVEYVDAEAEAAKEKEKNEASSSSGGG